MSKFDLTTAQLKEELKRSGVKINPSYMHKDYITPSFSMPYPVKNKLDEMTKFIGCTRSSFVSALIIKAFERFENGDSAFGD